jgi:molybdenum cofactor guanylyltransferase
MSLPIAALILAGGASSRMGQDKALLLWQGVPMLQRVINAAAQCCPEIYLLTPRTEIYRTHLKSQIKNQTRYHWLPETMPPQGPLVALSQGLGKIPAEWVLVLACDLPLLDGKILNQWRSQLPHLSPSILALVPYHQYWHPLCGFYRPQALPSLEKFLSQRGKSFQAWLPSLPAQKIPLEMSEINMLWNCNSPADLNLQQ